MTAVCRAYDRAADADQAVARVLAAGVPADDIRVLRGAWVHDARRAAAGGYAGPPLAGARPGSFAGGGTAVRGGFAGDASDRPEGVFGNSDRDVVVTHANGSTQVRVAGHRLLKGLLMDAGLDEATAEADLRSLHDGRVVVLIHGGRAGIDAIAATLDATTPAAA